MAAAAAGIAGSLLERAASEALGFGIGTALSRALEPEATQLAQEAWHGRPELALDPQSAATVAAKGKAPMDRGANEAQSAGLNSNRFALLVEAFWNAPATSELLELRRRGVLDEGRLRAGLRQSLLHPEWIDAVVALTRVHLSPADAAMARQQGFIDAGKARDIAALSGVNADDADLLFEMSGLPPGIGMAWELARRGFIGRDMFAQIVREGHTKTKYTDLLWDLLDVPISAAVAAEAVVRERITFEQGAALAAKQGISHESFALMVETGGRPPGIMTAAQLVNRGEMTHEQFREVVARSNVRTEYTDQLLKLRVHYPSLFQISRALQNGVVSDEVARDTLHKQGYPPEWVEAIIRAGHSSKKEKHKELTLSVVEALYAAGRKDINWAKGELTKLGYDDEQAIELLDLYDARREIHYLNSAIGVIHNRFIAHAIDELTARGDLEKLGIPPDEVARLLDDWVIEHDAAVHVLTPAQIGQALRYKRFTRDEAIARWEKRGYSPDDAETLAWIVEKGPPHPPA